MTTRRKQTSAASRPARGGGVPMARRYAVVLAGGVGTRFWPWSREAKPKQLLALTSGRSMLAETVARLAGIVPAENVLVVTGRRYRRQVLEACPGLDPACVLGEPTGRNTAAAIAWATLEVRRRSADAVVAVLSADHRIGGGRAFARDLVQAFAVADRTDRLVTFGIRPSSPATGYGYIRTGRANDGGAFEVDAFVEKPDLATARRYVAGGRHFWNSGMFVWRVGAIWRELAAHLPALAAALEKMDAKRRRGVVPPSVLDEAWPKLPSISIDYGVLEKSRGVVMLAATFAWADIGSWDAAAALWPADDQGNASRDPLLAIDASGNIVATRGKPVVLLGVEGLVVVDAGDALLVGVRERSQDVRMVVDRLQGAGLGELR